MDHDTDDRAPSLIHPTSKVPPHLMFSGDTAADCFSVRNTLHAFVATSSAVVPANVPMLKSLRAISKLSEQRYGNASLAKHQIIHASPRARLRRLSERTPHDVTCSLHSASTIIRNSALFTPPTNVSLWMPYHARTEATPFPQNVEQSTIQVGFSILLNWITAPSSLLSTLPSKWCCMHRS